ncbi:hypothetical protein BRD05_10100 [Halobacteriales archaeon QS_9_70_65]|nr:MAG: hypothetical protein BRD05_10100 [Halobacteriales archaeon QS_9_70_65]
MAVAEPGRTPGHDHDVVIAGGGPAGCSAGVVYAREGLDTVVFDRGRSSIRRGAHLENYLGFPAGVDIETFRELIHDHAEAAEGVDRIRRKANLDDECTDRDQWIEWFGDHYGEDAPVAPESDRFRRVRETYTDAEPSMYLPDDGIDEYAKRAHETLAERLNPSAVTAASENASGGESDGVDAESAVDTLGSDTLPDAIDDEAITAYVIDHGLVEAGGHR